MLSIPGLKLRSPLLQAQAVDLLSLRFALTRRSILSLIDAYVIFLICLILSSYQAYRLGRKKGQKRGISGAVEWLIKNGWIDVEDEEEIKAGI
jgi:hypothetical protein